MTNPKLSTCAEHLAADFLRVFERHSPDAPPPPRDATARALYSLLYSGTILCPIREHRIGISLRQDATA